jgi:2-keto-4-pentenoate hydratase/2-oxohepta-3-ene-1,7-dioic acid hydratase in catechol pathway
MRIVGFETEGGPRLGIVEADSVVDLQAIDPRVPNDLGEWLRANDGDLAPLRDLARRAPASAHRPLATIRHGLPVARPGKILCLGLNYLEHAKEGGHARPQFPSVFLRCTTSLVPHLAPILRPAASETLDYEAELVAIIGRRVKHVSAADALACIAGYACFNDGSVREFQRRTSQWDMGKNFDRTGAFGPWMVSADELPQGAKGLPIESRLNGKVMQSDDTANMLFPVAETIVILSEGMTLEPGDLVLTGTPAGVGKLEPGDEVEVEVLGLSRVRNPVTAN